MLPPDLESQEQLPPGNSADQFVNSVASRACEIGIDGKTITIPLQKLLEGSRETSSNILAVGLFYRPPDESSLSVIEIHMLLNEPLIVDPQDTNYQAQWEKIRVLQDLFTFPRSSDDTLLDLFVTTGSQHHQTAEELRNELMEMQGSDEGQLLGLIETSQSILVES